MSAETIDGGRLREAATRNGDENILLQITDKDCTAIEVRYHKRCYQRYTEFLRTEDGEESKESEVRPQYKYKKSFGVFCVKFVKEKIIDNEEIYYMQKVKEEFIRTVAAVENCDASNYKSFRLKNRLVERFPQLVFHRPNKRNKSEIVYADNLCRGMVAEHYLKEEILTSQSDTKTEDEVVDDRFLKNRDNLATLKEFYGVACTLRNILRSRTQTWYENWPPLSSDITGESVRKLVTPPLFNFFAWLLGFSEDPEASEYVEVSEGHAIKIFSICQDLIYVSSKGKIQTPKSLALAMAVRQITAVQV